jgi:hypothetical protein
MYSHDGPPLDLIIMNHSFYYFFEERHSVFSKLNTWLAKDGIIVLTAMGSDPGSAFVNEIGKFSFIWPVSVLPLSFSVILHFIQKNDNRDRAFKSKEQ